MQVVLLVHYLWYNYSPYGTIGFFISTCSVPYVLCLSLTKCLAVSLNLHYNISINHLHMAFFIVFISVIFVIIIGSEVIRGFNATLISSLSGHRRTYVCTTQSCIFTAFLDYSFTFHHPLLFYCFFRYSFSSSHLYI